MAGSNGRAKRHFFGGTGLYIALFLGVTALAVAGYWTLLPKNTTDAETEEVSSQQELPVREEAPRMPEAKLPQQAAEPEEDVTVMDEATGVEDTVPVIESSEEVTPDAPRRFPSMNCATTKPSATGARTTASTLPPRSARRCSPRAAAR